MVGFVVWDLSCRGCHDLRDMWRERSNVYYHTVAIVASRCRVCCVTRESTSHCVARFIIAHNFFSIQLRDSAKKSSAIPSCDLSLKTEAQRFLSTGHQHLLLRLELWAFRLCVATRRR